jgi:hypothetical protein
MPTCLRSAAQCEVAPQGPSEACVKLVGLGPSSWSPTKQAHFQPPPYRHLSTSGCGPRRPPIRQPLHLNADKTRLHQQRSRSIYLLLRPSERSLPHRRPPSVLATSPRPPTTPDPDCSIRIARWMTTGPSRIVTTPAIGGIGCVSDLPIHPFLFSPNTLCA